MATANCRYCVYLWMIMILIVIVWGLSSEGVENAKRNDIQGVLSLHEINPKKDKAAKEAQEKLLQIYTEMIKPLADQYRFSDLNIDPFSEDEIFAKPMIVFLGPWSTGKSTMINYLLGLEDNPERLYTGVEPTTSDFTVIMHGHDHRVVQGIQLISDKRKNYGGLQKFGLKFQERFQGAQFPSQLLERVTLVDTPGIIENKKQQERGYPFNEVCQWFIDRAQLIFLVFDPSKLDVGSELEVLFKQLKGHEGKLRLILNKADTVSPQELMRVYGALFWALAPLVNEVEPPRVYVVSLWSSPFKPGTMHSLFYEEEVSLLRDLQQVMNFHLENKIAAARRHAFLVRLHALVIDSYYNAFFSKRSRFFNNDDLWADILKNPEKHSIFNKLLKHSDISEHDLPAASRYDLFFSMNSLDNFSPLSEKWFGQSDMDRLVAAIKGDLPDLLHHLKRNTSQDYCTKDSGQC